MGKREERILGGSGPTLSDSLLRLFRLSLSSRVWAANESESFSCTAVSEGPDESSRAKPRLRRDAPPPAGNWCSALHFFSFFPQTPAPPPVSSSLIHFSTSVSRPWCSHSTTQHKHSRELHYLFNTRVFFCLTFFFGLAELPPSCEVSQDGMCSLLRKVEEEGQTKNPCVNNITSCYASPPRRLGLCLHQDHSCHTLPLSPM